MARILIIDDEASIRGALRQVFEYEGHRVKLSSNGPSGLIDYPNFKPDVTLLDVKMPKMDGLEVLSRIREKDSMAVVIMVSGHGTIGTAVEATRRGAFDFLEKPLDTDRLLVTLRNALLVRGLSESVERLEHEIEVRHEMVGGSDALRQVVQRIEKVGATDARALITGENGTGKELAARALHRLSPRAKQPFVEVNCAAIPATLIESELFGHVKGSFTGALSDRKGKFEQAHRGTLFLDEVGDMSLAAQAKVLRALEEGNITRVGGSRSISVDVRVIAATNKDLEKEIAEATFREDLYYRLNVVPIWIPPLRDRRTDIAMLVFHFANLVSGTGRVLPKQFSAGALGALENMNWPGNVRELKNTVERLMILSAGETVERQDVVHLAWAGEANNGIPRSIMALETYGEFKDAAEKAFIEAKLRQHGWNVAETARQMDMPRSNLYKKIERHGLERDT